MSPGLRSAERPAAGPAFALLDGEGLIAASTELFDGCVGAVPLDAPAVLDAVAVIIDGRADTAEFSVPVDGTPRTVRAEAVLTAQGWRLALLEVDVPYPEESADAVARWLARFVDDAEAMVLIKDPFGTHLALNPAYAAALTIEPGRVLGRRDADLAVLETLDGPRAREASDSTPSALEYTVPAFDRRPAFAVFRFPITDSAGEPLVSVSVASRSDDPTIARRECERILRLGAWLSTDHDQLRRDVIGEWRVSPARPLHARHHASSTSPAAPAAATPAPAAPAAAAPPASVPATSVPAAAIELERLIESVAAAGQAAATSTERVIELERELRETHAELLRERAERTAAQDGLQTQLNLANQRFQAELAQLRTRALEAEATRSGLEGRLAQLSDQLAASQREVLELHAALRAARHAAREGDAPAADAAMPPDETAAPAESHPSRTEPARLGWSSEAQAALADGLRGCLNLRSVLSEAVRLVGTGGGWELTAAWVPLADGTSVATSATWLRSPVEMAALETSLWQEPQRHPATIAGAVTADAPTWHDLTGPVTDPHLRRLAGAGLATAVLVPVRDGERPVCVLELTTAQRVAPVAAADASLTSIAGEVAVAAHRVTVGAAQNQWGRRR